MQLDRKLSRLAIPSKGRLQESSEQLLKAAGIKFRKRERSLLAHVEGLDLAVLFVRPDDIPILVAEGAADLGIVGRDLVHEHACEQRVTQVLDLDFGHCRTCLAARTSGKIRKVKDLAGLKVAASMVHTAREYFRQRKVKAQVVEVSGSVEIMAALGLADAIVDLVESGDTLRDNGLHIIETIAPSQAILIQGSHVRDAQLCARVRRRLEGVLTARQYTLLEYNINRAALKEADKIAPGFDSPTISETKNKNIVAVKVMIPKLRSVEIMDKLEGLGASAILETAILNCRL